MKNEREKSDASKVAKRPVNKPKVAEVDLWGLRGGVGGAKGWGRGEHWRATHVPDTEPGKRVQGLERYESLQSSRLRQQLMIIIPESAPHEALSLCDNTSKGLENPSSHGFSGNPYLSAIGFWRCGSG